MMSVATNLTGNRAYDFFCSITHDIIATENIFQNGTQLPHF